MENKLHLFENEEFGKVRVVEVNGQPWFILKDICQVLKLSNPTMIAERLDDDVKDILKPKPDLVLDIPNRGLIIVNESGLYAVILRSDKPEVKNFRRWVTTDILPSIRKHGVYITDEALERVLESPTFAAWLFQEIVQERKKSAALEDRVEELAPKARYFDTITQAHNAVPVSVIAKDYGMSAASFNKLLHGLRIQYKIGDTWLPYQPLAGQGYTRTRTYYISEEKTAVHTYWTQKGRFFLYETLRKYDILPLIESHAASNGGSFH